MNSLEATRVLTVLEETLENLRLFSFVTEEVVFSADRLQDVLGEDVCEKLAKHGEVLAAWHQQQQERLQLHQLQQQHNGLDPRTGLHVEEGGDQEQWEAAVRTTLALLRALRASPEAEAHLASLQPDRSDAMVQALEHCEKVMSQVRKRLGTTVEEDASRREHQAVLKERHERAAAEKLQLEHKLKLHRLERSRQLGVLQAAQDAAAAELSALHAEASAACSAADSGAAAEAKADDGAFLAQQRALKKALDAARQELSSLREDARSALAAARKARRRAEGDCEAAIAEYDGDRGERDRELMAAEAAHQELTKQIEECVSELEALRQERLAYEEELRAAAAEAKRREIQQVRLDAAAYTIQNAWKGLKKKQAAEAKAKGKGKGAKEGAQTASKKK